MPQNIINRMTVERVSSSGFLPWTHHANVSATTKRRRLLLLCRPRGVKMDSRMLCNFYRWTIEPVLPSIGQGMQLGSHPWFVGTAASGSVLQIRNSLIPQAIKLINSEAKNTHKHFNDHICTSEHLQLCEHLWISIDICILLLLLLFCLSRVDYP